MASGYDFSKIDNLMADGVAQEIFPGAVLLVAVRGEVAFQRAYGMADLFSRRAMTAATVFDLASLTKPLATTLAVMLLVQQGRLALDRPGADYWRGLDRSDKAAMTIRHLLSHCSGLPAWRPYYLRLAGVAPEGRMALVQQWVVSEPLATGPGKRVLYSDVGFMVLQWIVEQVTGQPLDQFYRSGILAPLAIDDLFFPAAGVPLHPPSFAATELCPLRGRLVQGSVHDDNAHALGGIAGHAGLFGTASAVWSLLQGLLDADRGEASHPLFSQALIKTFFQRQSQGTWALGFDTPSHTGSSAGHHFSANSVGHLGFTGTSFWMARDQGVVVILLANRVHPSRYDYRIRWFRPELHDAVMQALPCG